MRTSGTGNETNTGAATLGNATTGASETPAMPDIMGILPVDLGRDYSEADVGLDLDLGSVTDEASSVSLGARNALGVVPSLAVSEFLRYAGMHDVSNPHMGRKVLHSMRVATLSVALAGEGEYRGAGMDLGVMFLAGLFHDCARFPQFAMFRSYDDHATGCDHGDLGADLLGRYGLLARVMGRCREHDGDGPHPSRDVPGLATGAIVESVRWHNKKDLPEGLDPSVVPYARALRDADVIDIMRLWLAGHMSDAPRPVSRAEASDAVVRAILRHQTVDRRDIRTDGDRVLSKAALPWALSDTARGHMAHTLGLGRT